MKYRKKPVVVEAFQMTEENYLRYEEWPEWLKASYRGCKDCEGTLQFGYDSEGHFYLEIVTLEGKHKVSWGDYIIRGIKGELYPCKPEIFEATYEKVS